MRAIPTPRSRRRCRKPSRKNHPAIEFLILSIIVAIGLLIASLILRRRKLSGGDGNRGARIGLVLANGLVRLSSLVIVPLRPLPSESNGQCNRRYGGPIGEARSAREFTGHFWKRVASRSDETAGQTPYEFLVSVQHEVVEESEKARTITECT